MGRRWEFRWEGRDATAFTDVHSVVCGGVTTDGDTECSVTYRVIQSNEDGQHTDYRRRKVDIDNLQWDEDELDVLHEQTFVNGDGELRLQMKDGVGCYAIEEGRPNMKGQRRDTTLKCTDNRTVLSKGDASNLTGSHTGIGTDTKRFGERNTV